MLRENLQAGIHHVGIALRDPESFAVAWSEGRSRYQWPVWVSILVTAIIGTTTYGMTMGMLGGAGAPGTAETKGIAHASHSLGC